MKVDLPYRRKDGLHLLINSTGIKVASEGEWQPRKRVGSERRRWRKIPITVDEKALKILALEVTSSAFGAVPILQDLLDQIALHEAITCAAAPYRDLLANRCLAADDA